MENEASGGADQAAIETAIRGFFASVLDLDRVDASDDFFALGGDSLAAENLMIEIERHFRITISVSALVEAATPSRLADVVARLLARNAGSVLLTARSRGAGLPLHCVHGGDGTSTFPARLAERLATDNPIYGLRARGLQDGEVPLATVGDMAELYLSAIRDGVQREGPYLLLGHCGGSIVAYEMARRLMARGETVAGLILIDPETDRRAPYLHATGAALAWRDLKGRERAARLALRLTVSPGVTGERRRRLVHRAISVAVMRYRPQPIGCPTLFICTEARKRPLMHPERGFPALLPRGRFVTLDVAHEKMFVDTIGDVVAAIAGFIEEVGDAPLLKEIPAREPLHPSGAVGAIPA
ncbi:alpha/beta fold hydrolase [Aquibium carbonis]|uniref:Alpha/beta fold hydrolase n=1 Tax=Aquibium carbonis TaxID=2495581 RepID=A0A3S0AV88_9HYPH|nr:alpha/beta fold hydrolase [Aquibium carbonis]RST87938.1 alpha/beta fold hydrolase [Aquibium carbonis]